MSPVKSISLQRLSCPFLALFLFACAGSEVPSVPTGNSPAGVGEFQAPPLSERPTQNQAAGPEERPATIADVIPEDPCTLQLMQYRNGSRGFDSLSAECQERQEQWKAWCMDHAVDPGSCNLPPNQADEINELSSRIQDNVITVPNIPLDFD